MHATAPGFTATRTLHAYDVASVPHSRLARKIQTLIVLPIRSGNKENPGKL